MNRVRKGEGGGGDKMIGPKRKALKFTTYRTVIIKNRILKRKETGQKNISHSVERKALTESRVQLDFHGGGWNGNE